MNRREKFNHLTQDGIFHIFAIDHRDVLTNKMAEKMGPIADDRIVLEKKLRLIEGVRDIASAILVDTHYFFKDKQLDRRMDMDRVLVGIERNNYDVSKIAEGYLSTDISIRELAQRGCNMVKLFVYYHPEMAFANEIDQVIAEAAKACGECQLPLMLEPILYHSAPENRLDLTRQMLARLKKFDIDLYKIDFPGDLDRYSPEENLAICREIGALLGKPWIILSSGVTLERFKAQLEIAGRAGACGYAAGRSIWNDFILNENLEGMKQAFSQIRAIAQAHCARWDA